MPCEVRTLWNLLKTYKPSEIIPSFFIGFALSQQRLWFSPNLPEYALRHADSSECDTSEKVCSSSAKPKMLFQVVFNLLWHESLENFACGVLLIWESSANKLSWVSWKTLFKLLFYTLKTSIFQNLPFSFSLCNSLAAATAFLIA